uniref:Uncharacterized protein n=1 Tax=Pithovirus LCPAC304 TaxID=2506594 RepID=A0A481ZA13_9VIRU|nr:MAG: uncharacterized protein LCPAC304_02810 [Pithovirus LCPAC304]
MDPFLNMSSSQSIPSTLCDLLSKLEFLGMIQRGQKPCMGDMTFVDGNSFWGALIRALKGEGNKGMLAHINQIIEQTVEAIGEYKGTEFLPILIEALTKAKIGIANLTTTYKDQPSVVARISVVITNINHQLRNYKGSLREGSLQTSDLRSLEQKKTIKEKR